MKFRRSTQIYFQTGTELSSLHKIYRTKEYVIKGMNCINIERSI
jgi:hypothetical protein